MITNLMSVMFICHIYLQLANLHLIIFRYNIEDVFCYNFSCYLYLHQINASELRFFIVTSWI